MKEIEKICHMSMLITIIFTIMAGAYWIDSARWKDKARLLPEGQKKQECMEYSNRAENVFKMTAAMMLLNLTIFAISIYVGEENKKVIKICKWLLLIPFISIIIFCFIYLSGRYYVPL